MLGVDPLAGVERALRSLPTSPTGIRNSYAYNIINFFLYMACVFSERRTANIQCADSIGGRN